MAKTKNINWKRAVEPSRDDRPEVWVVFGQKKDGYESLLEGEELIGYLEKIVESEKYNSPIASLISEDGSQRFLMFAPPNLVRQLKEVMAKCDGKKVLVKIIYKGKEKAKGKDGTPISFHSFEVLYTDELVLSEN